jgi:alpha-amylase
MPLDTDPEAWATGQATELGDAVDGAFEIELLELDRLVAARSASIETPHGPVPIRVIKDLRLGGDRRTPTLDLTVTIENRSMLALEALVGLEWTLTMLGGGGNPAAWWEMAGTRTGHDSRGTSAAVTAFAQGNDYVGVTVSTTVSRPAAAWWAPVETVSNSEGGFERVYQGSGLLLSWPLSLGPGGSFTVSVDHVVTTAYDRAAEETGAVAPVTVGA